ncbi:FG-GAP-like repeat-containing protein [Lysobacter fragariae]
MQLRSITVSALLAGALFTAPAHATFHLMKVVEVFAGTPAAPAAQYVVLQMYAGGQNFVGGHPVTVYNGAGTVVGEFTFSSNVSNGANQAKILIATPQAVTFFGLNADLIMSAALISAGGKVCFDTIDCVAWGGYSGDQTGVGVPFNFSGGGLLPGKAAIRRIDLVGSPTTLDSGDDTNNCVNDFVSGLPAPRNNAGVVGSIPASTCGNNVLEGLEECDDGNTSDNDTCSSTCKVQAAPYHPRGDYNIDGMSDLFWRNTSTGANRIWRSALSTAQTAVSTVASQDWKIACKSDFNGDGKADIFWRNSATGANDIWKSANSTTRQATPTVANAAWQVVAAGDFNGDGKGDVFWRNNSTGNDEIWNSGFSTQRRVLTTVTNLAWKVVGAGDFNGDGKADALWRNTSTGQNAVWLSATSSTQQAMTTVASQDWQVAGVGDFNNDGKDDVLWRNNVTGANALWRSASSSQQMAVTSVTDLAWKISDVGDYDGDHKADIFWRNSNTGANAIWKSAVSSTKQAVATVADLAWKVIP